MSTKLKEVILAAMFHDLGKFGQRAAAERSEQLKEQYCPVSNQGYHSHVHVLNTDHFIEKILPLPSSLGLNRSEIAKMAANHHKPDWESLEEACLVIADHLASGADRFSDNEWDEQDKDRNDYITSRLGSIFEEIHLQKHKIPSTSEMHVYRLRPINEEGAVYPEPLEKLKKREGQQEYAGHWRKFTEELKNHPVLHNKALHFDQYLGSLNTVLEKYLWCVPAASFRVIPDISLFDHGYLTSAIAQALYAYHQDQGGKPEDNSQDKQKKKFLLYGGDLSGIQKYIFQIDKSHSAGVAKIFRARSFYLQMVTKAVVCEALQRVGLYRVAQIMDAGGKFMLLLPNTTKVKDALSKLELQLDQEFLDQFHGQLSLNTCQLEASFEDLLLERFNTTLSDFFDLLDTAKLQRFSAFTSSPGYSPILEDERYKGDYEGNCQVCPIEIMDAECSQKFAKETGDPSARISRVCYEQIQLGKKLADEDNEHFELWKPTKEEDQGVALIAGWRVRFENSPSHSSEGWIFNRRGHQDFAFHPLAGNLPTIQTSDESRWVQQGIWADWVHEDKELPRFKPGKTPKTFEMIAHSDKAPHEGNSGGKQFLGVFKADVDNLGFIFSIGFDHGEQSNRLSISRFATLSRSMNYFFSVEMIELIKKECPDIYVIFAGGDDLFFLGPWAKLLDFGQRLRERFRAFTAGNPDISISAGIGVFKSKMPIRSIADQAEHLLNKAKSREVDQEIVKDGVCLFGDVVSWQELSEQLERGKELEKLLSDKVIQSGLANRLLQYSRQKRRFSSHKQMEDLLYRSHMSYDFARNLSPKQFTQKDYGIQDYQRFVGGWTGDDETWLANAEIPLHYALYRVRH